MVDTRFDVLVIGAGIAGASLAARLVDNGVSVALLEGESQPGYHTTGRSAAFYNPTHGPSLIRSLALGSYAFLESPPAGFADRPLVSPRGVLIIADEDQVPQFEHAISGDGQMRSLQPHEAAERVPILRTQRIARAALSPAALDIDVHALHDGFLRMFRRAGGELICEALVRSLEYADGLWHVATDNRTFVAPAVVNAAGAWAGTIGRCAGAMPIELEPRRRTALLVDLPAGVEASSWPLVSDAAYTFYFKSDAGKLMLSPYDATPTPPTDAQPEDLDVAVAVERFEQAVDFTVERVSHRWAGLRTFADDGCPVIGWDVQVPGFFWLAGQGGSGIQSAPLLSQIALNLILERDMPQPATDQRIDVRALSPRRFLSNSADTT